MAQDSAFQQRIQRIGEIVEQIDAGTDPHARAIAKELIESLMALHGGALERILEVAAENGEAGETIIRKFGHDELVSSVLLLYGLHPEGLRTRVERALEKAHKLLESHGATAKLGSVSDEGKVTVRLELKASACGSSAVSFMSTLESLIQDAAPDATSIVIEELGASLTRSGFVSVAKLESGKSMVELYAELGERSAD